jgi:putative transposase
MPLWPLETFDPNSEYAVVERKLPHWSQAGTVCFITFRTEDSMPREVLERWHADRVEWLRRHGVDGSSDDWKERLKGLDGRQRAEFNRMFSRRRHDELDDCHGACVLRRPELAKIVADSLLNFDGTRYVMCEFIVMPNHVHLLASFADMEGMLNQCESWKRFTARLINAQLGASGRFWQKDGFDHLVRSVEHFEAFRRYIAANPSRARLKPGEYIHYSAC